MKSIDEFTENKILDYQSSGIFGGNLTGNGAYYTDTYQDNDNSGTLSTGDTICILEKPIHIQKT